MQSQCPQCHTAFRVNEEQLSIADGKVRCGQCMHVFIASEYFIDEPTQTEDIVVPTTDEISIPLIDTDELTRPNDISIDDLIPAEIDSVEIEIPEIEVPVFDSIDIDETTRAEDDSPIIEASELPEELQEESQEEELDDNQKTVIDEIDETMAAANETWQESESSDENNEPDGIDSEDEELIESTTEQTEQTHKNSEINDTDDLIPLLVDSFDVNQLYPELDSAPKIEAAKHTGLYSIAIIILLTIFSVQAIYTLRETLAEQAALRPLMSSFCASLNCALSLPREPKKIILTRSEVRSHPSEKSALLVKASIQNQARFRQAYPILRLQFSDLDGRPLIGRDFLPEEYLPNDVSISSGMPINIDINLSLELLDPGGQAVSFDFRLL